MNIEKFMTMLETYYGKYNNELQRKLVYDYIRSNYNDNELNELFKKIIVSYSNRYNTPPGIYEFEELKQDSLAEQQWLLLRNVTDSYNIVCEDLTTQATIEAMGGWIKFNVMREEKPSLCYREFIKIYNSLSKSGIRGSRKILLGYYAYYYGQEISLDKIKIIGMMAKEEIIKMLEQRNNEQNLIENKIKEA